MYAHGEAHQSKYIISIITILPLKILGMCFLGYPTYDFYKVYGRALDMVNVGRHIYFPWIGAKTNKFHLHLVHFTLLEVETHFSVIDPSRGRQFFWIHAYPNVEVKGHLRRNANTHYSRIIGQIALLTL